MKTSRLATKEDFKVGSNLITKEGNEVTLLNEYLDGIWESSEDVHFEEYSDHYKVKL